MPVVDVKNLEGKKVGTVELADDVFSVKVNENGKALVPAAPGLGVEIDEAALPALAPPGPCALMRPLLLVGKQMHRVVGVQVNEHSPSSAVTSRGGVDAVTPAASADRARPAPRWRQCAVARSR